ncbi:MAG: tetratricopeptide repeat protein, partial [Candidatus Lokiarchaeota archaeon]|nr:tetratricopeptide repeat protein [Candidatus Lokiarchaeota archaeon]
MKFHIGDRMSKKKRRKGDALLEKAKNHLAGGQGYDTRVTLFELAEKYPERYDTEASIVNAMSYEVDGKPYKAESYLVDTVLVREPANVDSWDCLAYVLVQMDRLYDLENVVEHILKLKPDSISARRSLARGYANNERYDEAIQVYKEVVEMDPEDPMSWDQLGYTQYWA